LTSCAYILAEKNQGQLPFYLKIFIPKLLQYGDQTCATGAVLLGIGLGERRADDSTIVKQSQINPKEPTFAKAQSRHTIAMSSLIHTSETLKASEKADTATNVSPKTTPDPKQANNNAKPEAAPKPKYIPKHAPRYELEPTFSPKQVGEHLGLTHNAVQELINFGLTYGPRLHPTRGGLYPTFKGAKKRRVPYMAIERHKRHMAKLEGQRNLPATNLVELKIYTLEKAEIEDRPQED